MTIRLSRSALVALALALVALAGLLRWRAATADERRVRRVFATVGRLAEKRSPDVNPIVVALDTKRLSELLDAVVELRVPELGGRTWRERREDLAREAFAAKARAASLSLRFYDLEVAFPSEGRAVAVGEGRLAGALPEFGGAFDDTREVEVALRRDGSSGRWLVRRIEVRPVVAK